MKVSTSLTFLSVLLLQLLHRSVLGADNNKVQFTLLTQLKCDGVAVCAVSQPNKSMSVTSKAQCVLYCQHQRQQPESCVGVNHQEQNNTCDVFYYEVTKFKKSVKGCQYIRKGSVDNLNCAQIFPSFLPSDCAEILSKSGSNVNGLYTIYIGSGKSPLTVYCDMTTASGGWTVFQRRKDGSVDFYRNWADYATGFGIPSGEFWIAKRLKLRVDLTDFSGNTAFAEYDNFIVNSAADNYRLSSIGTYSGTAGDSLSYQLGSNFTTFDVDNDAWSSNCAVRYKGAWWYYSCHDSNLNGYFYPGGTIPTSSQDGVSWFGWRSIYYSLKSEMKIKPVI